MVRKEILGQSERNVLQAYLNGKRVKGYTTLFTRIRHLGLGEIISGCERDLDLLRKLAKKDVI
jgi:hypothetical protein